MVNVGEIIENHDTIAPPEHRDINPAVINGTEGNGNADEAVFNGTVNELVTIINEMKDELEQEGYSVDNILANVLIDLLQSVGEGMTANQVKQIIKHMRSTILPVQKLDKADAKKERFRKARKNAEGHWLDSENYWGALELSEIDKYWLLNAILENRKKDVEVWA